MLRRIGCISASLVLVMGIAILLYIALQIYRLPAPAHRESAIGDVPPRVLLVIWSGAVEPAGYHRVRAVASGCDTLALASPAPAVSCDASRHCESFEPRTRRYSSRLVGAWFSGQRRAVGHPDMSTRAWEPKRVGGR